MPLDLVPLALAVWLGTMVAVTGLIRLAEQNAVGSIHIDMSAVDVIQ